MRKPLFTGTCPALVTPFTSSGAVDHQKMKLLIDDVLAAGVDALCIAGTTGEAATLSLREHIALLDCVVRHVSGAVPVIAGAGKNDTAAACYLSRRLEEVGVNGLLHVTPYYNKTSQTGLIDHFTAVAQSVEIPIILYNVPARTGLGCTAETYRILSEIPNINGVKEASGNVSLVAHTIALCPADFTVWSGNDDQVVPLMAMGAKGVISVLANIAPKAMVAMTDHCLAGRYVLAMNEMTQYLPLMDALFAEVNPIPVKAAFALLGRDMGGLRPPLAPLGDTERQQLALILSNLSV